MKLKTQEDREENEFQSFIKDFNNMSRELKERELEVHIKKSNMIFIKIRYMREVLKNE